MIKNAPKKPFWEKRGIKVLLLCFFLATAIFWIIVNKIYAYETFNDYRILYSQPNRSDCLTITNGTTYPTSSLAFWQAEATGWATFLDMYDSTCGGQTEPSRFLVYNEAGQLIFTSPYKNNEAWRNIFTATSGAITGFQVQENNNYLITWQVAAGGSGNNNSWYASSTPAGYIFNVNLYTTSTIAIGTNAINIVYPTTTSTPDFNSWHIDYSFSTSTLYNAGHSIRYSNSSINLSDCTSYNNGSGCFMDFEPTYNQFELYAPIIKLNDLSIGNYQAQAILYNNNNVVATSSIISFYITGQPAISSLYEPPTITWATSTLPFQITCDPDSAWYAYSLCKVLVYLFVPDSNTLNKFNDLTAGISDKVPIGYFTRIKEELSGFSSTTPVFTLDIDENEPVYTEFFDPIRTGLSWILWFAFAFWIFHRFRHFNLTSP